MAELNRAGLAYRVLWLSAIADEAKAAAAAARAELDEPARAELETTGAAPTWRVQGLGSVSLSMTSDSVVVEDLAAYVDFLARLYPTEVERRPREAFDRQYRSGLAARGEPPCDPGTGEVVPGVRFVPGGQALGVRVRAAAEMKEHLRAEARALLGLEES